MDNDKDHRVPQSIQNGLITGCSHSMKARDGKRIWCDYCIANKEEYSPTDNFLIDQQLLRLRVELYAAAQILKGKHLDEFKKLIAEIANICNLEVSDTGTFLKTDVET